MLRVRLATLLVLAACSGGSGDAPSAPDPAAGGPAPPADAGADAEPRPTPNSCGRVPPAADGPRKVVVSHPYGEGGAKANRFEVLELSPGGELTKTGQTFEMGRSFSEIAFTPDGAVGLVAQDDGSIGVFAIDRAGTAHVVHAAFTGDFYASRIVLSRDGERAFVLDAQTEANGGGVHELAIACDGKLTSKGLVVPGGRAHAMALLPSDPDRAVLVAGKAIDSPAGTYAHRLDLSAAPTRLASGAVFGDDDAIASSVAVTRDGKWALVLDNGLAKGSRMAAVALDGMKAAAPIATPNPAAVAMSPFGNAALLLNSDGEDALRVVAYDPANAQAPFAVGAEVAYKGGKTQLPLIAAVVERGALKGRVLVAENTAVRQLAFRPDGGVEDLALLTFEGVPGIVGSLGVQP